MKKLQKMHLSIRILIRVLAVLFLFKLPVVLAQSFDYSGQVALEVRGFPEESLWPGQVEGAQFSSFLEPEFRWRNADRDSLLKFTPFIRVDAADDKRTHFDIREANWRKIAGDWEFLIGATRIFWGVTESRHLVSIINQIDYVEDIDEEDFLGQPMVQIGRQSDFGRFDIFLMTGFRERTFPGRDGRIRTPLPVKTGDAVYGNSAEQWHPDVALRYSHFFGDFDLGLHVFRGINREPSFVLSSDNQSFTPHYNLITQAGIDLQFTRDAWLWKFEGIVREGQGDTFAAVVAGVEYTFFQVAESDIDLGIIVEGLYDGRDKLNFNNIRDKQIFPTIFDKDIFLGARLAFNDVQDSSVLVGFVTDIEDGPATMRVEAERRLGEDLKIELIGQAFFEEAPKNPASFFMQDSFVTLRLSKFF
ncbi:hypothetical protein SAMN05216302_10146 [Nitrosomonas aestuarii]|uniref:Alginate export domain-containing protein n=1 Tax=Nitrosomonas aestuarii TaxID=52441 RepID=A0A1I4C022_9PROT|nr:hypothetical protein [Nitrosomonas aestuarii]SFK73767.1 hypothetical protein SAMN05216302_10146 [Nitrosomonas aestuarii]